MEARFRQLIYKVGKTRYIRYIIDAKHFNRLHFQLQGRYNSLHFKSGLFIAEYAVPFF